LLYYPLSLAAPYCLPSKSCAIALPSINEFTGFKVLLFWTGVLSVLDIDDMLHIFCIFLMADLAVLSETSAVFTALI